MRENEFTARLRAGAADIGAGVNPPSPDVIRGHGDRRRRRTMVASGVLAFVIGAGGGGVAYASLDRPAPSGKSVATGASPTPSASTAVSAPARPRIVAVTTRGAVEVLNPSTGAETKILFPGGDAIGDSVAVSPSGPTVYFSVKRGCTDYIESVPVTGGTPEEVATGVLPAVSPDGTQLAFVREPEGGAVTPVAYTCDQTTPPTGSQFKVVVLNLTSGKQTIYPAAPSQAQLPYPISHLSWSPDGTSLLVSVGPSQGNEGWGLYRLNLATARYYVPADWLGNGGSEPGVPVTGKPDAADSYYEEGVFLPGGGMFVDRMCCKGVPVKTTSTLLQEIDASGQLVSQPAIGYLNRAHTSLDASSDGQWLLYLSAHDLYLYTPSLGAFALTTSGFIAAAWVP